MTKFFHSLATFLAVLIANYSIAQVLEVDIYNSSIDIVTDNNTTNFDGPGHPGILYVTVGNNVNSVGVGGMSVNVSLNQYVHYVSAVSTPNFQITDFGDDYINLTNTVPITSGLSPIELQFNVVAVQPTTSPSTVIAGVNLTVPLQAQETAANKANNNTSRNTSVGTLALPVSLAGFSAKAVSKNVRLEWNTASERNNAYFEVQHSVDARNYETLGKVTGKGTTNVPQQYSFTHESPNPASIHYYRLKQVDTDGNYEYSPVRAVQFDSYVGIELRLASNPVTTGTVKAYIDYGDETLSNQAHVFLYDLLGRPLTTQTLQLQKGRNEVTLRAGMLESGLYLITLQNSSLDKPQSVRVAVQN